jgi:hypothetical protein
MVSHLSCVFYFLRLALKTSNSFHRPRDELLTIHTVQVTDFGLPGLLAGQEIDSTDVDIYKRECDSDNDFL